MNADVNVKLKPYDPNTPEGFKPQKAYSQILHHTLWLGKGRMLKIWYTIGWTNLETDTHLV